MKITPINHAYQKQHNNNVASKGGIERLNVANPIARCAENYFSRMAEISHSKIEPVCTELVDKISICQITNKNKKLLAWDINPKNSNKYILFFHGMAQNISNYQKLYSSIIDQSDFGILALEFRGYGENENLKKVTEDKLNSDTKAGLNYLLKDKKINPKNIILMGHSMGGELAVDLAGKNPDLKALILLSPLTNINYISDKFSENPNVGMGIPSKLKEFTKKFKPLNWLYELKFNSMKKVKKVKSPIYLIHSKNDIVTSLQGAETFTQKAKDNNIPIESFYLANGGHRVDSKKVNLCVDILKRFEN